MKKIFSLCLLILILSSLIASFGLSQKVADILEKMIEAKGERKVQDSIKDITLIASVEIVQAGLSRSVSMWLKKPKKLIGTNGGINGLGRAKISDGGIVWSVNPQTGNIEEMPKESAKESIMDALTSYFHVLHYDFLGYDALLHPEKYRISYSYSYEGKDKIRGKDCLHLEKTFSDGRKISQYVDSETYLIYKFQYTFSEADGDDIDAEVFMSDYRNVDGFMIAYEVVVYQDGEEYAKMVITEVRFNTGLENSLIKISE